VKVEIKNASNNWIDITPYIAWQGLTFSVNSVDSPDAGRDMSGLMHRGMIAIKEKMNVNTIQLTKAQVSTLISLLLPESFQVRVTPYPNTNSAKTMNMYSNNVKTTYIIHRASGEDLQSLSFPLIEL
jgi:hypothetical protein